MIPRVIVVMGVSGVGKTTIGRALASVEKLRFLDGDGYHSATSLAKMRSGVPLDEADRAPWLARLRQIIETALEGDQSGPGLVIACSALRSAHRRMLAREREAVRFVFLRGTFNLVSARLAQRQRREAHFMHPGLLRSQLDTLEEPPEGDALVVDAALPVHLIVQAIRAAF